MGIPGGVPEMRPDQALQPRSRAGTGPAPQQNVIQARIIIISGPNEGIYSYFPTPGKDNLIASTGVSVAGTDPFGNNTLAGDTVYGLFSGFFFALNLTDAQLNWYVGGAHQNSPYSLSFGFGQGALAAGVTPPILEVGGPQFGGISINGGTDWVMIAPSGDTTGVKDAAALHAAFTTLSVNAVLLLPGQWYVKAGNVTLGLNQYLRGSGTTNTNVRIVDNAAGNPGIKITNTGAYSTSQSAGIGQLTIDGTGTSLSNGLQAGNIVGLQFDNVQITNFTGAGRQGAYFLNDVNFTEQAHGDLFIGNCTRAAVFDVSAPGTFSFERCDLRFWLAQNDGQDGLVFAGGATGAAITDGALAVRGNFQSGAAGTGAVLRFTGTGSGIASSRLDIGVECDGVLTGPTSIKLTTGTINRCYGAMDFAAASSAFQASSPPDFTFNYVGPINGDTTLCSQPVWGVTAQNITANGQTIFLRNSSEVHLTSTGAFTGLILEQGINSQPLWLINDSGNAQTFAIAGTSNVANGVAAVVQPLTAMQLVYLSGTGLWYQVRQ